ncbi:MAG: hypothetical protein Q7U36_01525 [bacterium]|nr:hypothetical protein [bacterium]
MTSEQFGQSLEKPQTEKEKILKSLHRLRFEFIEEFPTEILLPDHPNYHLYKCRTNYFNGVSLKILRLQHMGLINSPEAKQECEDFFKFCDTIRGTTRFYQQEDIDKANKVLDCLIKELS